MSDKEKQFENFVRDITFDDTPDVNHRDKLERRLLAEMTRKPSRQTKTWRLIMKSNIAKLAAVAVIIVGVLIGANYFDVSIDGTSVAWAEVVQRVEQSYNQYYEELLFAMKEKDVKRVSSKADALSEFWQGINMLAEEGLESTEDSLSVLRHESFYNRFQEFDPQIFIAYAEHFIAWMDKIEDAAWINEIFHVSRQLEEYAEEIRELGRHPELDFSYAEHCLPSFIAYCEWFERLPWNNPKQQVTPAMLLSGIQRDLNIARREMETLELRGAIPFIKRCVQQAHKNALDLDRKSASSRTRKQRDLCRHLNRRIDELCALITYAEVMSQDFVEQIIRQNQYDQLAEKFEQVLTEEFGNKGSFADYYIKRIDQSLDLYGQLLAELESLQ